MLVHRQKKDTTPTPPSSTQEQATPPLPDQQTFRQYLRDLARGGIRVVLEDVMCEELDALIGVGWGECNPKRKGYANGSSRRDLVTSSGRLEDLKVSRDREGHFHTQVFGRYSRYEPHIVEGRDGDVRGRHEHPQGQRSGPNAHGSRWKSPARLVVSPRRCPNNLKPGASDRGLEHWRTVYLDGIHFSIRHGDKADSTIILTALGVDLEGHKEVVARPCLRRRGYRWMDLRGSHKQRNVLNAIPRRERADVAAELAGIWDQPTQEEAVTQLMAFKAKYSKRYLEAVRSLAEEEEKTLTFYDFPATMHRHIQITNAIESLWSLVRQRTDQIDVFTTETSCLTIVWATIQDIRLHTISV